MQCASSEIAVDYLSFLFGVGRSKTKNILTSTRTAATRTTNLHALFSRWQLTSPRELESLAGIMASATLVSAEWSRGKYDSYVLSRTGHFRGFLHPPGWAFMAEQDRGVGIADDFQFLSCRNVGSGLGAMCASLPGPFEKLQVNAPFSCSLVLHRGVCSSGGCGFYCPLVAWCGSCGGC